LAELLLLSINKIEDKKWHLYAMEMTYQKILRIIKTGNIEEIGENWRIGYITSVSSITDWSKEKQTYVTSKDKLVDKYDNFRGLMLNKASYPDRILSTLSGLSYGIIRLRQIDILEKGNRIGFTVWGFGQRYEAVVLDPWWEKYWHNRYTAESEKQYQKQLSAAKRKVFAVAEKNNDELFILKLIVF